MEKKIVISDRVKAGCPEYAMVYMEGNVKNGGTSAELMREFESLIARIQEEYELAEINKRPQIAATRAAYKTFGKDPNRYRPSQEQLMRRVVRGLGLYNVNSLVDTGNILSLTTGCSVGVFDMDMISGDVITVGVGEEGEPYEGIGRGPLNIAGIPVLRDSVGGFGTPTSDNERTKTRPETKRVSVTVHIFDSRDENLDNIAGLLTDFFARYCEAQEMEVAVIR